MLEKSYFNQIVPMGTMIIRTWSIKCQIK